MRLLKFNKVREKYEFDLCNIIIEIMLPLLFHYMCIRAWGMSSNNCIEY
jgi:hypothetical protein